MNRRKHPRSKAWLTGATATLAVFSGEQSSHAVQPALPPRVSEQLAMSLSRFAFQHEGVLGTSFDLLVGAVRADDARVCEQQVLAEIERLRLVLSTYDPASEISRVRAGAAVASPELQSLLSAYGLWAQRSGGSINVNMAGVIRLWQAAREAPPAPDALESAFRQPLAYNVDALGKGFIIDRAVEVARRFAPTGLLNIGGDIRAWGEVAWQIGIANPFAPAENSPLLGHFILRNGAVATSGGYSRFVTLAGRRYSHIIDPRTLQPAGQISSASIVAEDCLTANALATAATVLGLDEGIRLAKMSGAWEHFLVDARGRIDSSIMPTAVATDSAPPPAADKKPATDAPAGPAAEAAWPTNFQVKIDLSLKAPPAGRAPRPYVAVWVEDSNKKLVRTITVWGSNFKWLRELNTWWEVAGSYTDGYTQSITRATRPPGKYAIVWDGLNDKREPVPQGEYRIVMEVNREHGRHATESVTIKCGPEAQSAELRATSESDAAKVEYGAKSP